MKALKAGVRGVLVAGTAALLYAGMAVAPASAAPTPPDPPITIPPPLYCNGEQDHASSGTNVRIPLSTPVDRFLYIPEESGGWVLFCVDVTVDIVHPNRAELKVDLIEPDGTVRPLKAPGGMAGADLHRTYRRLVDSGGWFTLRVTDTVSGNGGYLDHWKLDGYYFYPE
jgi:hypothetical protein